MHFFMTPKIRILPLLEQKLRQSFIYEIDNLSNKLVYEQFSVSELCRQSRAQLHSIDL